MKLYRGLRKRRASVRDIVARNPTNKMIGFVRKDNFSTVVVLTYSLGCIFGWCVCVCMCVFVCVFALSGCGFDLFCGKIVFVSIFAGWSCVRCVEFPKHVFLFSAIFHES